LAGDEANAVTPTKFESCDNQGEQNGAKFALKSHESEASMDAPTDDSKRLPTGLVDYVVVVGQEDRTIVCSKVSPPRPASSSKLTSKDGIGAISGSPKNVSFTRSRPRQGVVWDRFPKQDYPDNPLPEKV
jgi:hypothetical protein